MFSLLQKNVEFIWTPKCQLSFEIIKEKLIFTPVLRGPNWNLPFHIYVDASDDVIRVVLGQEDENGGKYAIYFISKTLTPTERNYTTMEKEFLVVVHVINKF